MKAKRRLPELCVVNFMNSSVKIFRRKDEDISGEESIAEVAEKVGISKDLTNKLLASIKDDAIKEKLKKTTQEALDLGAFGSPMIVAEVDGKKEWVFGSDRFPILAQILDEKWVGPNPGISSKL